MTENYSILKSFVDLDDAIHFMESHLLERAKMGWTLSDTSGIQSMNNQWRVGLGFYIDHENPNLQPLLAEIEGDLLEVDVELENND